MPKNSANESYFHNRFYNILRSIFVGVGFNLK